MTTTSKLCLAGLLAVIITMILPCGLSSTAGIKLGVRRKQLHKKLGTIIHGTKHSRLPYFDMDKRNNKAMGPSISPNVAEQLSSQQPIHHLKDSKSSSSTNFVESQGVQFQSHEKTPDYLVRKKLRASAAAEYNCPLYANSNGNGKALIQADPVDCSQYYYCVWGKPVISSCTWPLLWNDDIKACDWYYMVNCKNKRVNNTK
jgi:hypothetical protein